MVKNQKDYIKNQKYFYYHKKASIYIYRKTQKDFKKNFFDFNFLLVFTQQFTIDICGKEDYYIETNKCSL